MSRLFCLSALMVFFALGGCQQKSCISGNVTYNGAAVENGYVTLSPLNKGHASSAPIANGKYTIAEIKPGHYTAVAIGTRKINHYSTSAEAYANANKEGTHVSEAADYIAQDAAGNGKQVEVVNGDQTFDLAITGPAMTASKAP